MDTEYGYIVCNCKGEDGFNVPAARRVSGATTKNPNRPFWTCPKGNDERCKFFKWEDDLQKAAKRPRSEFTKPEVYGNVARTMPVQQTTEDSAINMCLQLLKEHLDRSTQQQDLLMSKMDEMSRIFKDALQTVVDYK